MNLQVIALSCTATVSKCLHPIDMPKLAFGCPNIRQVVSKPNTNRCICLRVTYPSRNKNIAPFHILIPSNLFLSLETQTYKAFLELSRPIFLVL